MNHTLIKNCLTLKDNFIFLTATFYATLYYLQHDSTYEFNEKLYLTNFLYEVLLTFRKIL